MNTLAPEHFAEFFEALHGHHPFPWQETLAETVCTGHWPQAIDLPTASGKTACLDIALFSLAVTRNTPRRMFFVVDRRVIVNEAFQRMRKVAGKLSEAKSGILASVAATLRDLAGGGSARPLDVHQLRGGIYRDQSWVRTPLQPTIITSTVDQVGSRLLFRGYGVSDSSAPIHAALIANDALIFLDEAHCSRAFSQTLSAVRAYRGDHWARTSLKKAFSFVEMTATPSQETDLPFRLTNADYENEVLKLRLYAEKPTTLHLPVKARANDRETLPATLARQAIDIAKESGARRIAVMVNRVATARRVFEILSKQVAPENLHLLIGRMRPIDRDKLIERLAPLKAGEKRDPQAPPVFVVSTQCLEVGADLDFDVLVTECASIDALLQRFGRLDRTGGCKGSARGCIIALSGIVDSKEPDPIYGQCLAETWRWLNQLAGDSRQLNMGIESPDSAKPSVGQALKSMPREEAVKLRLVGQAAPALLPSHLDAFVQTSPKPHADPDVALFLHGRQEGPAEIQVVWRKDLDDAPLESWKAIVALCPPVSAEAMPVRLEHFRRWLTGGKLSTIADSDLEGVGENDNSDSEPEQTKPKPALIWRGDDSCTVNRASEMRPNDTIVLALSEQGWDDFGHMPQPADVAEEAIRQARARIVFRVHEKLWPQPIPRELTILIENEEFDWNVWESLVTTNLDHLALFGVASANSRDFKTPLPYPFKQGELPKGWLLQLRQKVQAAESLLNEDQGNDEISRTETAVTLADHTEDVERSVETFAAQLLPDFVETLKEAARLHDAGKADPRFQAMLHGGDHIAAAFYPDLLAKSDAQSSGLYKSSKAKSGLPEHFRHELISLHFAAKLHSIRADFDAIQHLIASHHGYCRPFAPLVIDPNPPNVSWESQEICSSQRLANPAHHLANGVERRFWRFTREFGWWGSAFLESCLRLADWAASEIEQARKDAK